MVLLRRAHPETALLQRLLLAFYSHTYFLSDVCGTLVCFATLLQPEIVYSNRCAGVWQNLLKPNITSRIRRVYQTLQTGIISKTDNVDNRISRMSL